MSDTGSWHDICVQMVVMISQKLTHVPMKDEEEPEDETASDPQIRKFLKRRNTDTCCARSMTFLMKNSGSNFLMRI